MDRATASVLAQLRQDTSELVREALTLAKLAEDLCDATEDADVAAPYAAAVPLHRGRHLRVVKGLLIGGAAAMVAVRKVAIGASAAALAASATAIVALPLVTSTPPGNASPVPVVVHRHARRRIQPVPVVTRRRERQERHSAPPVITQAPQQPVITGAPGPDPSPAGVPADPTPTPTPTPLVSVSVSPPVPVPLPTQSLCVTGLICLGL